MIRDRKIIPFEEMKRLRKEKWIVFAFTCEYCGKASTNALPASLKYIKCYNCKKDIEVKDG